MSTMNPNWPNLLTIHQSMDWYQVCAVHRGRWCVVYRCQWSIIYECQQCINVHCAVHYCRWCIVYHLCQWCLVYWYQWCVLQHINIGDTYRVYKQSQSPEHFHFFSRKFHVKKYNILSWRYKVNTTFARMGGFGQPNKRG